MRGFWGLLLLVAAGAGPLPASIDGTVVNSTTGKPQAGVTVTLVKPGQGGMRTLGSATTDAAGRFVFEKDEPGGGPQLLQANYKGVNYNKLMTPNIPTSNVELDVYEATKSPAVAQIAQHMMLFEPSSGRVAVSETVVVQNKSNTTYSNAALGSLQFYLPPAANGQVRVNAQGPQGMPLPQAAQKAPEADMYKVDFPIKPGETEFEVNYLIPAGTPQTFRGRVAGVKGMPAGPLRLIAPPGVTITGKDIQNVGTEPKTQATVYTVTAADAFTVDLAGTGSLHSEQAEAPDTSDEPPVLAGKPRIYTHLGWLIGLAFGVLGIGLAVLYRSSPVRSPYGK
ncbi:MAG: carboxypeptidase regulatory-like domain-containing protein [Acidobacteriaceae bacterium]|nr:carboxypeptidase regulatory-like domain-containing protein [Acidobacteriaceae bacterium]MBV8570655.1 carboxypeptidase regulatory-like domain-containing protein [Acidobacteriaceae bacterium]